MARKPEPTLRDKVREVLGWIKAIGIASGVLGGVVLTQTPELFPYCAALVYIGFGLIAFDLYFEPFFEKLRTRSKVMVAVLFITLLSLFTYAVVLVKSPLDVDAFMTDAEYPPGTTIAGIAWKPEFTEVRVSIKNSSKRAYDDLNIVLRPSSAVAAIAQVTTVSDVSFTDPNGFTVRMMDIKSNDQRTAVPFDLLGTDAGYRLRCGHLPAHGEIVVVLALADMKWPPPSYLKQMPQDQQVRDINYMVRFKMDDFSTYWQGHAGGDSYASRPTSSEWIKVEGEYIGAQRIRTISRKIQVGGRLTITR